MGTSFWLDSLDSLHVKPLTLPKTNSNSVGVWAPKANIFFILPTIQFAGAIVVSFREGAPPKKWTAGNWHFIFHPFAEEHHFRSLHEGAFRSFSGRVHPRSWTAQLEKKMVLEPRSSRIFTRAKLRLSSPINLPARGGGPEAKAPTPPPATPAQRSGGSGARAWLGAACARCWPHPRGQILRAFFRQKKNTFSTPKKYEIP